MIRIFLILSFLSLSCDGQLPKPKAFLRLEYPKPVYREFDSPCPFRFLINDRATIQYLEDCDLRIEYKSLKAQIFINYNPVDKNLENLMQDAQKFTYKHVIKAESIFETPYENKLEKKYGMLYKVKGNAASHTQFYLTDSIKHFITGTLYFKARPNYDSIIPAIHYLDNDIKLLIESLQW